MSVSAFSFSEHMKEKLDDAEASLDDLLLSQESKDQFSRYGFMILNVSGLNLTDRELNCLFPRYKEDWNILMVSSNPQKVKFEPAAKRQAPDERTPRERALERDVAAARNMIRELAGQVRNLDAGTTARIAKIM